jgi:hypothetical protein
MATTTEIPRPVRSVVGEILGAHIYSHRRINNLFFECGAKSEPPEGNCADKIERWLGQSEADLGTDPTQLLGAVLENYMELDAAFGQTKQSAGQERIREVLAQHGLSYGKGGRIIGASVRSPAKNLSQLLRDRDWESVHREFDRALEYVERDPPSAVTAACAIVESLCKLIIDEESLALPTKQTVKPLWSVVQKHLGLGPSEVADDDITRILSGLSSVVDGIGALRTHAGSAHGGGRKIYRLEGRHARLAIHSAHTLATFIIETWHRKSPR